MTASSNASDSPSDDALRVYESVIKVEIHDPPGRRARDIADGIGYACALLMDEYGWDVDAIVGILEQAMSDVEDAAARRG